MSSLLIKTDNELVLLLRKGDESAFSELYERYWGVLFRHASFMLGDESICKDVLQEVFVTLWDKAMILRTDTNIKAYLYKLVRNQVLNILAKEKTKTAHLSHFKIFIESNPTLPDEIFREKELNTIIESEIDSMPQKMKEIFELSRVHQLSHQEIAIKLDISTNTVKSQITNALKRIRRRIHAIVFFLFLIFLLLILR